MPLECKALLDTHEIPRSLPHATLQPYNITESFGDGIADALSMSAEDRKGTLLSAALLGVSGPRAQKTASGIPNLSTKKSLLN